VPTSVVLFVSLFIAALLRCAIIGERFDRALHQVDPTYRNIRDMGRAVVTDPIGALRELPRMYGHYYGVTFRPVEDPTVEHLRRRAIRAFVDVFPIVLGGLLGVLLFARVLRPISPGVLEITVVAVEALLVVYWGRQLLDEVRGNDRYPLGVLLILLGIGTAVGAIAATIL
jgi:hypothetical protein